MLTGTLVILPAAARRALDAEAAAMRIAADRGCAGARSPAAPVISAWRRRATALSALVALVTRLFQRGAIRLLVGTQALLGEGWDAPAINSLILASNAGSYMLSNQMRGRAIRIDPAAPGQGRRDLAPRDGRRLGAAAKRWRRERRCRLCWPGASMPSKGIVERGGPQRSRTGWTGSALDFGAEPVGPRMKRR